MHQERLSFNCHSSLWPAYLSYYCKCAMFLLLKHFFYFVKNVKLSSLKELLNFELCVHYTTIFPKPFESNLSTSYPNSPQFFGCICYKAISYITTLHHSNQKIKRHIPPCHLQSPFTFCQLSWMFHAAKRFNPKSYIAFCFPSLFLFTKALFIWGKEKSCCKDYSSKQPKLNC